MEKMWFRLKKTPNDSSLKNDGMNFIYRSFGMDVNILQREVGTWIKISSPIPLAEKLF
jgi:hypothetical protein